ARARAARARGNSPCGSGGLLVRLEQWGVPPPIGARAEASAHHGPRHLGSLHTRAPRHRALHQVPRAARCRAVHRRTRPLPPRGRVALTRLGGWDRTLACVRAALDHKAYALVVLETGPMSSLADYFVICSGRSDTQVQAIADAIDGALRDRGERPLSIEGMQHGQWVLMDYGDVVIH